MDGNVYDVIQVGYGPVSQALALMLGRQHRSVAVCERWPVRYALPRAVCVDHELHRVLWANGMGSMLPSITEAGPLYQWFNAEWKELLVIDWARPSVSGGPEVSFVHQPTLEEALDAEVARLPGVEVFLGWEVLDVSQDTELAHVRLRYAATGEEKRLRARYVVGCDGANSLVRRTIGGEQEDRGFEADWLVVDVLLKPGVTIEQLGIPAAGQFCDPLRPTTIVPAGRRDGRTFRRWEFMRLPGEDVASLEDEARVWDLLRPWAGPGDVELVRHKVYNFRSLLATRWRDRRLLIAGDAAHVMPPFMGQGMCSGLRDAWNLAWKLHLVLDGVADDRLLDTYGSERFPHVSQMIDLSIYLGRIICIPDPADAAARDAAFLGGTAAPLPPFPHLTAGLLHRDGNGQVADGAGLLAPHVHVEHDGAVLRLDELTGAGFVAIGRDLDPRHVLPAELQAILDRIGVRYVALGTGPGRTTDWDGRLDAFMAARGWAAMVVRPDFHVYGGAANAPALVALAGELAAVLTGSPRQEPGMAEHPQQDRVHAHG